MSETEFLAEAQNTSAPKTFRAPSPSSPSPLEQTAEAPLTPSIARSLQRFLTLPLLLLSIPIVLAGLWGLSQLFKPMLERSGAQALEAQASVAAHQIAEGLRNRSQLSAAIGKSAAQLLNITPPASLPELMNALTRPLQPLGDADLADAQGKIIWTSSSSPATSLPTGQTPWFLSGSQRPFVSDLYNTQASNTTDLSHRLMDFSSPVEASNGLTGVFVIHSSSDWIQELLPAVPTGIQGQPKAEVFVFDRAGSLIFAPSGKLAAWQALGQSLPVRAPNVSSRIPSQPSEVQKVLWKDRSEPFLTTVTPLPALSAATDMGWLIVARTPLAAVHQPLLMWLFYALAGGVALCLLGAGLLMQRSGKLSQQLAALKEMVSNFGRSDGYAAHSPSFSIREIDQLAQSFRATTQRMQHTHEALAQEVQARTQELNEANRELDRQASTDPLTGLLNRRGFDAQIQFAMSLARRSGRPLCFMTLDIDHFRQVNEQYGTEVGDLVLKSVGTQLRNRLRDSDIISRFGGEEFMVLLPDTPPEAAQRIGRELLYNIEHHRWPLVGTLTLSAGITALRPTLQNGTEDSDEGLMRRSEEAMLKSKEAGRNQVHYIP